MPTIVFLVAEDCFFLSHCFPLAEACRDAGWTVVVAASNDGRRADLEASGFRYEAIPFDHGGMNPLKASYTLVAIWKMLRRHRPDILHCVALKPILYGHLAAVLAGVKVTVGTVSGFGCLFSGKRLRLAVHRKVIVPMLSLLIKRRGAHLIVQNEDDHRLVLDAGLVAADHLLLIPGFGVEVEALRPIDKRIVVRDHMQLYDRLLAPKKSFRLMVLGAASSPHIMNRAMAMAAVGNRVTLISPTEPFGPCAGIDVQVMRGRTLAKALRTALFLWTHPHDAVQAHYAAEIGTWVSALLNPRPLSISVMGGDVLFDEQGSLGPFGRLLTRLALRRAQLVTVKSSHLRDRVLAMHVAPQRIEEVIWGIDLEHFCPDEGRRQRQRQIWGLPEAAVVLLSPRMLIPFYNQALMVKVLARLYPAHPGLYLVLSTFGQDSDFRERLENLAKELKVSDRVRWVPPVFNEGMADLYAGSDMVLSLPPSDGFPQAILEALACGCPVVAGDMPQFHPILESGVNAMLPKIEVDEVMRAVNTLIEDDFLRNQIIGNGRKTVAEVANLRQQAGLVSRHLHAMVGRTS